MNLPQIGSIKEGTIFVHVGMPGPWPLPNPRTIAEFKLNDGIAYLVCDPSGSLRVTVHDSEDRPVLNVLTCPIDIPQPTSAKICFSWSLPDDWGLAINGKLVGSDDPSKIPERLLLEKRPPPQKREDFSRQNNLAVRRRHDRLAGWQPIPGRVKSTNPEIRAALEDEILQIQDLLAHLRDEKVYHAKGLSARLRMLIATGNPLPLLQLYAANKDKPLIAYVSEIPVADADDDLVAHFSAATIQAQPSDEYPSPIDLDVWLDTLWGAFGGKPFTHREAIKAIADTVGSHFDQDALPLTIALRTTKSELHGINTDLMLIYIGHVAVIVAQLAQALLKEE